MATEPTGPQIIAGGETVAAAMRNGTTRAIFVAQCRPSQLDGYLAAEAQGDLGPIGFVTGLSSAELDELSLAGLEALLEADLRQNFSYARRYEQRRAEAAARQFEALRLVAPEQFEALRVKLAELLSPSLDSSPASPPPAAAGAPPPK